MTTSGQINNTSYDTIQIIEQARRRAGLTPGSQVSEDLYAAQNELYFYMQQLINAGVPLWTVTKQIYGLNINQYLLPFTSGTIDIENILYRYNVLPSGGSPFSSAGGNAGNAFDQNLSTACTQTSTNGYISYNFNTPVNIVTVGLLPNATASLNPTYEYSVDNVNWVQAIAPTSSSATFTAKQWYWQDVPQPFTAQYFRIRETSGGTLNVTEVVFGQPANEVIVSRSNKDDYQNLPNKNIVSGNQRPLQYWFDRQITPQIWMWPPSGYSFNSLVLWRRRELQDVGPSFTNTIEFPSRWLDTVIWNLAARIAYVIKGVDLKRIPLLEAKAMMSEKMTWAEERDASPFFMSPAIGCYTRGK